MTPAPNLALVRQPSSRVTSISNATIPSTASSSIPSSHHSTSTPTSTVAAGGGHSISGGAIAGISIGALLGLALVVGSMSLHRLESAAEKSNMKTAQRAAAYYHDAPELLPTWEKQPNANPLSELQGSMIRPGAELDSQSASYLSPVAADHPGVELDGHQSGYAPMAMATTVSPSELDGSGPVGVPQYYPQQTFVPHTYNSHVLSDRLAGLEGRQ